MITRTIAIHIVKKPANKKGCTVNQTHGAPPTTNPTMNAPTNAEYNLPGEERKYRNEIYITFNMGEIELGGMTRLQNLKKLKVIKQTFILLATWRQSSCFEDLVLNLEQ